jgi:hypothetical protein
LSGDILPPTPPGTKQPVVKEKKKGFLASFFGAKKEKPEPVPNPELKAGPAKNSPEVPGDIDLDDIRKQLGLEPAKISSRETKAAEEEKKYLFELPDIEEPPRVGEEEKSPFLEEDVIEEPPKIAPRYMSEISQKAVKKQLGKKTKNEVGPATGGMDWTSNVDEKKPVKNESDFLEDLEPAELKPLKPSTSEFLAEVQPQDVKEVAKAIKRKKFEAEKGIQYEPEVSIETEPEEIIKRPAEKEEYLIDASPEEEIAQIKERLRGEMAEKKPEPIIEKKAEPEKKEEPEVEEPPMLSSEPSLEEEDFPQLKEESAKLKTEEPPLLLRDKSFVMSKSITEIEAEFKEKMTEKIREDEKAKAKAELEEARKALEKDKQLLEQEKILVAGKASRYDFKDKQLRKEKSAFAAEKEQFEKDKQEAEELVEKLPQMRKDHDGLHQRMTEIYENLKKYDNREDELHRIEQTIEEKENILREAQQRLEEIEERIKEKGFSDYLETELKEEPLVSPKFEEEDISKVSNLEVYNLIDNCKAMIMDKNFLEAKRVYMELRNSYTTLNMESNEKDLLYAAIRELYDDIKLAEMENTGL